MALTAVDSTVAANVAAATTQEEQRDAKVAPFASDDVTVRFYAGATLAETGTFGPVVTDSDTPRGWTLGPLLASTVHVPDATITHAIYRTAGGQDILQADAEDLALTAPTTKAGRRTNLADAVRTKVRHTAQASLPVAPAAPTTATLSGSGTATTGVAHTSRVTLDEAADQTYTVTWSRSDSATGSATSDITTGNTYVEATSTWNAASAGRTVDFTISPTLTRAGRPLSVAVSDAGSLSITGPSSGLERALSTVFEVSHTGTLAGTLTVTLSDGDSNSRFYSLSSSDAAGTVSLGPSVPVARFFYAPSSDGSKSVTMTNDGGLTNPSAHAYTATAAAGSATPFRLTRGGSTIGSYASLVAARSVIQANDTIKVAAGTYPVLDNYADPGSLGVRDYVGSVETGIEWDNLTIEAEDINDPPLLDFSWWCAGGLRSGGQPQAITAGINNCRTLTLRGLHLRGSPAPQGNSSISAAFWQMTDYPAGDGPAASFTYDRCLFTGWGDAIKGRYHLSSSYYIHSCVFIDNSDAASGLHHDIYTGNSALTEVVGCTFIRTGTVGLKQEGYGHFVKSRCRTTRVKASRFLAYMDAEFFGGSNSLINTPCGGVVEVTGNILIDYGAAGNGSAHNILRSAEQQFPTSGEPSTDPLLNTHSYLIAQNTTLQRPGYAVLPGNEPRVLSLYHIPSNDPNGTVVSSGVPTYAMTGSGTMVPVTTTVRNNIVGHYNSTKLSEFLSQYPNNTTAGVSEISDLGYYTGGTVAGSPSVNDAALEWAGEYLAAVARTDTNRGARSILIPAWRAGLTPLTWYEVGGNTLHDIRPTNDPAVNPNYPSTAPWATNGPQSTIITDWGGGAWDETNQRLWVAGGGHACYYGNEPYTINLDANSPVWVMRGFPTGSIQRPVTTVAARKVGDTDVGQDGRPLSIHTYGLLTVLGNGRLFLGYGGFGYDSSGTAIAEFDPVADDWDMATGRYTVAIGDADVIGSVEYDPTRNKVWQAAGSRITSYDCAAKTATRNYLSYSGGVSGGVALRRMPEHDLLAVFSGNANSFGTGKHVTLVDPSSPGSAPIGINATTQNWGLRGVAYDTLRKRFLAWNGGGAVETLTPPATNPKTNAWAYGSLTTSTAVATPSAAHANGTYGRVVYSAKYDCLIVINGTTEQLYVLPLS